MYRYFVGAEFNLAIVDRVKLVIGQLTSIVYYTCAQVKTPIMTDETISKQLHEKSMVETKKHAQMRTDGQIKRLQHRIPLAEQKTQMRTVENPSQQPGYHWQLQASGYFGYCHTEQLLLDNTATTRCIQWFN
jgi:hypothetical protein